MSSAGMLGGGFRVSSGRPSINIGGRSVGQSFSQCALQSLDRDSERATRGAAVQSSDASPCYLQGGLSSIQRSSSAGVHCSSSSASHEFSSMASRSSPRVSAFGSGLLMPMGDNSTGVSSSSSALNCRSREGLSMGRVLSSSSLAGGNLNCLQGLGSIPLRSPRRSSGRSVRAMGGSPDEKKALSSSPGFREAGDMLLDKGVWNTNQYLSSARSESDESWEQINMILRVVYAMAMYGGLAVAGSALCIFTGVDCSGGFELSIDTVVQGLGYAVPPMMALLFILEDEVVKVCPPARAIRDVEDEELIDFFVGMNKWQFIFVVAAGALSEEMFFRVAIQGGLAHALQYTAKDVNYSTIGISALTSIIPFVTPFAQACAAVLTASITGSMYYIISAPSDPTYVIAPVSGNKFGRNNRRDIKKRISAWYERRQLKKIYSPLMEALLALYLGFEWVQTGNILGPMITHTLYSLVVVGNGLRRIHDNREKLRQRVSEVTQNKDEVGSVTLENSNQPN